MKLRKLSFLSPLTLWQISGLVMALCSAGSTVQAQDSDASPFQIQPSVVAKDGQTWLEITFRVPEQHHLYADRLQFELNRTRASFALPTPKEILEKKKAKKRLVFEGNFVARSPLPEPRPSKTSLTIQLQGCNDEECFFPETRTWLIDAANTVHRRPDLSPADSLPEQKPLMAGDFRVAGRASGFLSQARFLEFLDRSSAGRVLANDVKGTLASAGLFAMLGLTLLGGLGLNFTPCVLPMMPIHLAILGAGKGNPDRRMRFRRGLAYGGGMALAYGGLGLAVVLTGSRFGTLQSSPWFNFSIAIIFVVMALAMFDKLVIDFSRFYSSKPQSKRSYASFLGAASMGAVSALLAGACVAPVIVSVLVLSTALYQKGNLLALFLPFVLGLGMAIPWPFAASGLTFLPKPGTWMTRVKYGFGVLIVGFAGWYGWLGYSLVSDRMAATTIWNADVTSSIDQLSEAMEKARITKQPVVVDFWASWCKNCSAMEHSTFRSPAVRERLKDYLVVRFQAEHLNDAALKPVLNEFGVMGLPTFVVLVPDEGTTNRQSRVVAQIQNL